MRTTGGPAGLRAPPPYAFFATVRAAHAKSANTCGPVWFRWQIQTYVAEERRLGRRGWYERRIQRH